MSASKTVAAPKAAPLVSERGDGVHRIGGLSADGDWALQINPDASQDALMAAVASRLTGLYSHLDGWSMAKDADLSAYELAVMLLPQAEEAVQIMGALSKKLLPAEAEGGAA